MPRLIALACLALVAASTPASPAAAPQGPLPEARSELTLPEAAGAPGKTVVLQVKLRDQPGTPLGLDRPFGQRIQGLALRVECLPEGAVESVKVKRAGATAAAAPLFEARPVSGQSAGLVASFDEATQLLPLPPTARERVTVARVEVVLARDVAPGTVVEVRFDPRATMLSNQAGTVSESVANGWLETRDGAIRVGR